MGLRAGKGARDTAPTDVLGAPPAWHPMGTAPRYGDSQGKGNRMGSPMLGCHWKVPVAVPKVSGGGGLPHGITP